MTELTQSYLCAEAKAPLLYETIGNCFDRTVEQWPDREALIVGHQNIRWSYREYQAEVERLATGLLSLGIQPGQRVGIWGPNCYVSGGGRFLICFRRW